MQHSLSQRVPLQRPPRLLQWALAVAIVAGLSSTSSAQVVEMHTTHGVVVFKLDAVAAPTTVGNFLEYVDARFYDGLVFHRVIKGFMIQGGGFDKALAKKKTGKPIKLEAGRGLSNVRGSLAMARTSSPNSATSQFFINHKDNRRLDTVGGGYAVFGRVISGINVVDKIANTPVASQGSMRTVPVTPVVILKMLIINKSAAP